MIGILLKHFSFFFSYHWWRRVEWREVLSVSSSVADSRQVPPGWIVWLRQATVLGWPAAFQLSSSTLNLHPIAHHHRRSECRPNAVVWNDCVMVCRCSWRWNRWVYRLLSALVTFIYRKAPKPHMEAKHKILKPTRSLTAWLTTDINYMKTCVRPYWI